MSKRYSWDDLYKRADDHAFGSPELRAKDEARYQLRELILKQTGEDIEDSEIPEDAIDTYVDCNEVWFDENGNIIEAEGLEATGSFDDVYVFVPSKNQIVRIAEGTGDNLLGEDIEAGYVDYIIYEQYELDQGMPEMDGGQMMSETLVQSRYNQLADSIPDIMDMAYDDPNIERVILSAWSRKNFQ